VGPFAILIARAGKALRVYAVDANPDAVKLIEQNAALNKVQDKVRPVLADADAFAASLRGQCDRVIMNLPQSAEEHWETALAACKAQAVVHYHRILDKGSEAAHAAGLVERARRAGFEARVVLQREVRAYSPGSNHVAMDFEVRRMPTA
jgi:tRNA (guanine37-N1)-methyltransferase